MVVLLQPASLMHRTGATVADLLTTVLDRGTVVAVGERFTDVLDKVRQHLSGGERGPVDGIQQVSVEARPLSLIHI